MYDRLGFVICIVITVQSYIADEEKKRGIDRSRIVVGGISQGGAVTLYSMFAIEQEPLAGIFVLSTWLPMHTAFPTVSWVSFISISSFQRLLFFICLSLLMTLYCYQMLILQLVLTANSVSHITTHQPHFGFHINIP